MQDLLNSESNDEIDLREFSMILWTYKLIIAGSCALGIIFGSYHVLNTVNKLRSIAIFNLNQNKNGNRTKFIYCI